MDDAPLIRLAHVTKSFGAEHAPEVVLRDVSLEVESGSYVSIMGRSGSGKSTLLNIIGALVQASSGSVVVNSEDLSTLSQEEAARFRRESIGFVFQAFHLLPRLTVWENVALPLLIDGRRSGRALRERATAELDRLGLAHLADAVPTVLSGGQQQRVAVARALVDRPPLLLADEPTGNLDVESAAAVLDAFDVIRREQDTTLVVITHDVDVAQRAPRRLTIDDGVLVDSALGATA